MRVIAAVDFLRYGTGAVTVDEGGGDIMPTSLAADGSTAAGSRVCHLDLSGIFPGTYTAIADVLADKFNANSPKGITYSMTFDVSTMRYTLTASSAVALTFSTLGAAGERGAYVLGFSGDRTSATSHVSDQNAGLIIVPQIEGFADVTDPYEIGEAAFGAVTDDGDDFTVDRETLPLGDDVTVQFETWAATFRDAPGAAAFTWQDFFAHVRGAVPFVLYDEVAGSGTVHRLRPEGCAFNEETRQKHVADWRDAWRIRLRTYRKGTL